MLLLGDERLVHRRPAEGVERVHGRHRGDDHQQQHLVPFALEDCHDVLYLTESEIGTRFTSALSGCWYVPVSWNSVSWNSDYWGP